MTKEERERILAQKWTDLPCGDGSAAIINHGPRWARRYVLAHHDDGACVFLSPEGRCRIHERFGEQAKPLACRLYPFLLVPAGSTWRVGIRFACPTVAASQGRPISAHRDLVKQCAGLVEKSYGAPTALLPPRLQPGQAVTWEDIPAFIDTCSAILTESRGPLEHRLRHWLALARLCRQANFAQVKGPRLRELLRLLSMGAAAEILAAVDVRRPSWVGRVLFRQFLSLYSRQDRGPNRGGAQRSRVALLRAAWRFARGSGPVPQVHAALPGVSFEEVERLSRQPGSDDEAALLRYYRVKLESCQFFGSANFGLPFWEGLESLTLTYPVIAWLTQALASNSTGANPVLQALSIADNNFGYNALLGTPRQRFTLRILSRRGELDRLVAWYGRAS